MTERHDGGSSRDRILETAITIIDAEGEAGVRVDRIAELAGITKPSIYHFFASRDGLIVAAQAERYRRSLLFSLPALMESVRACRSRDEFSMIIRNRIRSFSLPEGKHRRRERIQVLGSAVSRPALRAQLLDVEARATGDFVTMLTFAHEQGWITTRFDFTVVARWWFGVMLGRHLVDDVLDGEESEEWTEIVIEAMEHIIYGTPAPS